MKYPEGHFHQPLDPYEAIPVGHPDEPDVVVSDDYSLQEWTEIVKNLRKFSSCEAANSFVKANPRPGTTIYRY